MPVDYWAMGVLLFEMMTGSAPWVTGDSVQDSELNIYARISGHKAGQLTCPKEFSQDLVSLSNELLQPLPDRRIGKRGAGPEELRAHSWFSGVQIDALMNDSAKAPFKAAELCIEKNTAMSQAPPALPSRASRLEHLHQQSI